MVAVTIEETGGFELRSISSQSNGRNGGLVIVGMMVMVVMMGGGYLLVLLGVLLSEMLRNAGEVELSALLTALARLACVHRLVLAFGV